MKNLLLPTDLSELAQTAYPAAGALARKHGMKIHLAYVAETVHPLHYQGMDLNYPKGVSYELLRENLHREAIHPAFQGVSVDTHLLFEEPDHNALVHFAQRAEMDLILLATHGRTGLGHFLLGSFAERVVRYSPIPVVTLRSRTGAPGTVQSDLPSSVLVPYDFSENARAVLPSVRFLAKHYGSHFKFLYVIEPEHTHFDRFPSEAYFKSVQQAIRQAPERAKARYAELAAKELEGVQAEFEVREGSPYQEIVAAAKEGESDLILMATHGWTGLKHFLLGSVAEKVVRTASCSVLTIRPARIRAAAGRTEAESTTSSAG